MHHPWFADMKTRMKIRPYKPKQTASFRLRKLEDAEEAEPDMRAHGQRGQKKAGSPQTGAGPGEPAAPANTEATRRGREEWG